MATMAGIFKAYDVRGVYPTEIDEESVRRIGFAFARFLNKRHRAIGIVIGRDMRDSSRSLTNALAEGILAYGTDVYDIGLSTTPMLYYAIIDGGFDGGVMVTASHLPAQSNGLKLCREEAISLSSHAGLPEVEAIFRDISHLPAKRGHHHELDLLSRYVEQLTRFVKHPAPLRIVVDAGNGMGGLDTQPLLARFPNYTFIPMYMQPDGDFPHHVPNPAIPATTAELEQRVLAEQADVGIAFDGDGDRCGFVDERGQRIPSDLVIAALAELFLQEEPGATIAYDLRASRVVPERIRKLGGDPIRTRVGHSFIKEKMREVDAVFGGELSGHYYYRDIGTVDSGIFSMISLLNLLGLKKMPVSQIIRPLQKYAQTGELNFEVSDSTRLFHDLENRYHDGQQDDLDGLTVTYDHWWFNLRESHTEPVVRLVLEADDQPTLQRETERLREIITRYKGNKTGTRSTGAIHSTGLKR